MQVTSSWTGVPLDPQALANPCGSFARAFFNDTYTLTYQGTKIEIQENGITWPGEQGGQYARSTDSNQTQWIDPLNEHFIVWMRPSGLPDFKKLWGIINVSLEKGNYELNIQNNYSNELWEGGKYIVLNTVSSLGAQNYTLPVIMMLMSALCMVFFCVIAKLAYRYTRLIKD